MNWSETCDGEVWGGAGPLGWVHHSLISQPPPTQQSSEMGRKARGGGDETLMGLTLVRRRKAKSETKTAIRGEAAVSLDHWQLSLNYQKSQKHTEIVKYLGEMPGTQHFFPELEQL